MAQLSWRQRVKQMQSIYLTNARAETEQADYKLVARKIKYADMAQLAEQLICNQQVIGSSPIVGFLDL